MKADTNTIIIAIIIVIILTKIIIIIIIIIIVIILIITIVIISSSLENSRIVSDLSLGVKRTLESWLTVSIEMVSQ